MKEIVNGEKDFIYYPVTVHTLNRFEHFRRLVESLRRNTDADKTELVIGLDYPPSDKYREGYERIKQYLPQIEGFRKVTIFTTDKNLGAFKNGQRLRDYVRDSGYDGYIGSEDDNEFSPNFIQYMNWGLNHFRDDQTVYSICACSILNAENLRNNVYMVNDLMVGWGVGFWFDRSEKIYKFRDLSYLKTILDDIPFFSSITSKLHKSASILFMLRGGWAYGDTIPNLLNDNERWCVYPKITKVRNWGCEGSGIHGKNMKAFKKFSKMELDTDTTFTPSNNEFRSAMMEARSKVYIRRTPIQYLRELILVFIYKLTGKTIVVNRGKKWPKIKLLKVL